MRISNFKLICILIVLILVLYHINNMEQCFVYMRQESTSLTQFEFQTRIDSSLSWETLSQLIPN